MDNGDRAYPRFGEPVNQFGGCSVDGVPAPCGYALSLLNNGNAALCPNGDCGARRVFVDGHARIAPPPVYTDQGVGYGRWVESTGNAPNHVPSSDDGDTVVVNIDQRGEHYEWVTDPAGIVFVDGLQRLTPQNPALKKGPDAAQNALQNKSCADLFGDLSVYGFKNPLDLLNTYLNNGLIRVGSSYPTLGGSEKFDSPGIGAITSLALGSYTNANGVKVNASIITVNKNGFYFSGRNERGIPLSTIRGRGFQGLNLAQIQGAVLIHELLHAIGRIPSDDSKILKDNGAQSRANSELVRKNCFGGK